MSFRLDVFLHDLLSFDFAGAALVTLWISVAAMLLGLAIGLALALMQQCRFRLLRWLAWSYLWVFRGTPVLLQIIFAFNVLPGFGVILSGSVCAVLALGLHEAAYMAEIFRSGLGAVNAGQRDAARALGMSEWQVMRLVVLPQALRVVIPPIGNQFIRHAEVECGLDQRDRGARAFAGCRAVGLRHVPLSGGAVGGRRLLSGVYHRADVAAACAGT